jgi:hypothetical protein
MLNMATWKLREGGIPRKWLAKAANAPRRGSVKKQRERRRLVG